MLCYVLSISKVVNISSTVIVVVFINYVRNYVHVIGKACWCTVMCLTV